MKKVIVFPGTGERQRGPVINEVNEAPDLGVEPPLLIPRNTRQILEAMQRIHSDKKADNVTVNTQAVAQRLIKLLGE